MKDCRGNEIKVGDKVAVSLFIQIGESRIALGTVKSIYEPWNSATIDHDFEEKRKTCPCFSSQEILKL